MTGTIRFILKYQWYVFLVSLLAMLAMVAGGYRQGTGPFVILMFASLALYFMGHAVLRSIAFTVWVFAFVAASNLMTYLARGNVALSVTMTFCSTLISPLMTPLMMRALAGQ